MGLGCHVHVGKGVGFLCPPEYQLLGKQTVLLEAEPRQSNFSSDYTNSATTDHQLSIRGNFVLPQTFKNVWRWFLLFTNLRLKEEKVNKTNLQNYQIISPIALQERRHKSFPLEIMHNCCASIRVRKKLSSFPFL